MNERIYQVTNPHRVTWAVRFMSEDAAWGRIFALKGKLEDAPEVRAAFLKNGWKVELVGD